MVKLNFHLVQERFCESLLLKKNGCCIVISLHTYLRTFIHLPFKTNDKIHLKRSQMNADTHIHTLTWRRTPTHIYILTASLTYAMLIYIHIYISLNQNRLLFQSFFTYFDKSWITTMSIHLTKCKSTQIYIIDLRKRYIWCLSKFCSTFPM